MINRLHTMPLNLITVNKTNTNLDDYTEVGVYFFANAYKPSGLPSIAYGNGWLVVLPATSNNFAKQIWIALGLSINNENRNHIFTRGQFGESGWSEWVQIPTESVGI